MSEIESLTDGKRPRVDVLNWKPRSWDQCIGNARLLRYLRDEAREVRGLIDSGHSLANFSPRNILVSGPLRSGKTSQCKLFLRALTCAALDEHLNPCDGTCGPCSEKVDTVGQSGLFSVVTNGDGRPCIDVRQVDCGRVTPGEVKAIIDSIPFETNELMVVLWDEAHRLAAKQADEMLLKVAEERQCMFILATVAPEQLDPMLRGRFLNLKTELPTQEELARFLLDRCREWDIGTDEFGLMSLLKKSKRLPGIALNALALALALRQDLTSHFVENVWRPPWE